MVEMKHIDLENKMALSDSLQTFLTFLIYASNILVNYNAKTINRYLYGSPQFPFYITEFRELKNGSTSIQYRSSFLLADYFNWNFNNSM
jgi:hypothetical protein